MEIRKIRERLHALLSELTGGAETSVEWLLSGNVQTLDSVLVLRWVLAIEQEFGVVLLDEEIRPETFGNLDTLSELVQGKLPR